MAWNHIPKIIFHLDILFRTNPMIINLTWYDFDISSRGSIIFHKKGPGILSPITWLTLQNTGSIQGFEILKACILFWEKRCSSSNSKVCYCVKSLNESLRQPFMSMPYGTMIEVICFEKQQVKGDQLGTGPFTSNKMLLNFLCDFIYSFQLIGFQ